MELSNIDYVGFIYAILVFIGGLIGNFCYISFYF
jgi:hypothetical protein